MNPETYKPKHGQQNEEDKSKERVRETGEVNLKEMLSASYPKVSADDLQEASERVAKVFQNMIESETISCAVYELNENTAKEIPLRMYATSGKRLFRKETGEWFYQEKYRTNDEGGKIQEVSPTEAKNIILTYIKEEPFRAGSGAKFDQEIAYNALEKYFPESYLDLQEEQPQPTETDSRHRRSRSRRRGR